MLNQIQSNRITSGYSAIVSGKSTALAGCKNPNCGLECLRKNERLLYREDLNRTGEPNCQHLIPEND